MKVMFRLTLSSYVMVVVASVPAFAKQEAGFAATRVALVGAESAERPSPAPAVALPVRAAASEAARLPLASSAAADTLGVSISGPAEVRSAATPSYRAAVGNGASDSRYYYWWFAANCARRIGCAPSSYALVAEGLGRDSVAVAVTALSAEKNLVVQVAEIDGRHRTGSSPMFVVAGPAERPAASAGNAGRTSCDWFAGRFYPHTGDYTDPYSGRSWPRRFRRDYCGNRVQWDPES